MGHPQTTQVRLAAQAARIVSHFPDVSIKSQSRSFRRVLFPIPAGRWCCCPAVKPPGCSFSALQSSVCATKMTLGVCVCFYGGWAGFCFMRAQFSVNPPLTPLALGTFTDKSL